MWKLRDGVLNHSNGMLDVARLVDFGCPDEGAPEAVGGDGFSQLPQELLQAGANDVDVIDARQVRNSFPALKLFHQIPHRRVGPVGTAESRM